MNTVTIRYYWGHTYSVTLKLDQAGLEKQLGKEPTLKTHYTSPEEKRIAKAEYELWQARKGQLNKQNSSTLQGYDKAYKKARELAVANHCKVQDLVLSEVD